MARLELAAQPIGVFVIDDHPSFLRTAGMVIDATDGFTLVGSATSGADALRQLDGDGPPPDLVLVDAVMPEMTGMAFAETFMAVSEPARAVGAPSPPVVLMSSYDTSDLPNNCLATGAIAAFVAKAELAPARLASLWAETGVAKNPHRWKMSRAEPVVSELPGSTGRDPDHGEDDAND